MIRDAAFLRLLGAEVVLYAIALALLHAQNWGPKDVTWSLWATSGPLTCRCSSAAACIDARTVFRGGYFLPLGHMLQLRHDGKKMVEFT